MKLLNVTLEEYSELFRMPELLDTMTSWTAIQLLLTKPGARVFAAMREHEGRHIPRDSGILRDINMKYWENKNGTMSVKR